MKERDKILKFQIFSIIFVSILGIILHFTYEWSNNNIIIASFSAINESVWEHLKLIFFPMLITAIIGYFYFKEDKFICAVTKGIIFALLFVVVFFYTYTGIIGTNFAIFDIGSFFVAIILGEYVLYKNMINNKKCDKKISIVILTTLLILFIVFTYYTPKIALFN